MTVIENPLLLRKKASDEAYQVKRSLRFNQTDTTYLNRTFSIGNTRIWTWAGWVKRTNIFGSINNQIDVFWEARTSGSNLSMFQFNGNDELEVYNYPGSYTTQKITNRKFTDPSAWYHICISYNGEAGGTKIFVNGLQETSFGTNNEASLNEEWMFNTANAHQLGRRADGTTPHFNGYLADVHWIDGMALSPAAFGSFNAAGAWSPAEFSLPAPNDGTTWSSGGTTGGTTGNWNEPTYGVGELFDGNVTSTPGGACNDSNTWNGATYTLPKAVPVKCQVRVYTNATDDRWGYDIGNGFERAANLPAPAGSGAPYIWTLPTTTEFKGISCSDAQQIFGIEVDGVVLKDGRTDPTTRNNINNGTQWSSQVSGTAYTNQGGDKAFDGRTDTLSQASNPGEASLTWTPTSSITGHVEILIAAGAHGGSVTGEFDLKIGNVSKFNNSIWPNNVTKWVDLGTQTIDTTYGLKWGNSTGGNWHGIKMIKIDGVPLVDNADDNSCHLKFDDVSSNAAIGTDSFGNGNWTVNNLTVGPSNVHGISSTGTFESGRDAYKAFNGLVGGTSYAHAASGQTCTISFTAVTGITKLRLNIAKNNTGDNWGTFELNDTDDITSWLQSNHGSTGYNGTWIDVTSQLTGTSLSKLEFSTSGNNDVRVAGVEVNDNLLVAGVEDDSLVDSPSSYGTDTGAGGEVRGNYCTMNPLDIHADADLDQGNLYYKREGAWKHGRGTFGMSTGKWYFEAESIDDSGTPHGVVGIANKDSNFTENYGGTGNPGIHAAYGNATSLGGMNMDGSWTGSVNFTAGHYFGIAVDMDAGTVRFYRDGVIDSGATTIDFDGPFFPWVGAHGTGWILNFGQRPFRMTAPTGHKALCTTNLPNAFTTTDHENNVSKVFSIRTYNGTGEATRNLIYPFSPDFIWIKNRGTTGWQHVIYDRIRGAGSGSTTKSISSDSNRTEASGNDTNHGHLSAFNSDGVTLTKGSQGGGDYVNHDGWSYVGWSWDAGSSVASTSNGGSATSYTRWTNSEAGFSIITATMSTGSGYHQKTVDHGLGIKPGLIIDKGRDAAENWHVYHQHIPSKVMFLETTDDQDSSSWKVSATSTTQFTYDSYGAAQNYVFYVWAPKQGYSNFGGYEGGTANKFIYCGFKPKLVLIKCYDVAGESWFFYDSERGSTAYLCPDTTLQEYTNANTVHFNANGFLLPGTGNGSNGASKNYIYGAWAEHPFKTANAGGTVY